MRFPEKSGRCWRDGIPIDAALPPEVNGEWQPDLGASLIDRVIKGIAIGFDRAMGSENLSHAGMTPEPPDFSRREPGILGSDDNRSHEPIVFGKPLLDLIVIICADQGAGIIGICQGRGFHRLVARQNGNADVIAIKVLFLHNTIIVLFLFGPDILAGETLRMKPGAVTVRI